MIAPRFHNRFSVFLASFVVAGLLAHAEPPPVVASPTAELRNAQTPRLKPQVIYHLPPASPYAAALHSQAKTHRHDLTIDSNMPTSLQMSRAAANEAAAEARAKSVAPPRPPNARPASRPAPKTREIKRSVAPRHSAGKGKGPGNSHGKKSHRK